MPKPSREEIRVAIKEKLQRVYSGTIHTSRLVDVRDDQEFVQVVLIDGAVTGDPDINPNAMLRAQLVIGYSIKLKEPEGEDDDYALPADKDLDAVIDRLNGVVTAKRFLAGMIAGVLFRSFEYVDDDLQEFSSVKYTYDLYY